MKILASILSTIGLYLGYWIAKSIYFSTLSGGTAVGELIKADWIIAGVVCAIICLTNYLIFDSGTGFLGVVLVIIVTIAISIPFSLGFVVLFNIAMLACVFCSIWKK